MKKLVAALIITGVLALGVYRFMMPAETQDRPNWRRGGRSLNVIVSEVVFEPVRSRLEAIGTSRAIQSIIVTPRVDAEVTKVAFQPGDYVEKGAVLVELDAREQKLAVKLAEVRLAQAERALKRANDLAARGTTTEAATDEARATRDESRIALEQAKIALVDRTIKAPFAGFVGASDIDVGDRVTPTTPVTSLDDRSKLLVRFEAPEQFISFLRVSQGVAVKPLTGNLLESPAAEISDIGSRVDEANRTFPVRAMVDNKNDQFRPGQGFRISLDIDGEKYASLPEVSLLWGSNGAYIWKVVDGKAQRVPANVVARRTGKVLVDADLKPGDVVVSEGVQRVRDGFAVKSTSAYAGSKPSLKASRRPVENAVAAAGGR